MRFAVAGCKIYIGGAIDEKSVDFVEADFTGQSWQQIGEWDTMGPTGDATADIVSQVINEARDKHAKGTYNAALENHVFNVDPNDAGQLAVIAASKSKNNYAFKIVYNDAPVIGASPKPSEDKFIALVQTATKQGGTANTIRKLSVDLQPNSNVVYKAPSAT